MVIITYENDPAKFKKATKVLIAAIERRGMSERDNNSTCTTRGQDKHS